MSIKLTNYVYEKKVGEGEDIETPLEKFILVTLADMANDEGFCWPSRATIERKTGCSRTTVKKALRKFEGVLIERTRKTRENGSDASCLYLFIDYIKINGIDITDSPLFNHPVKDNSGGLPKPPRGALTAPAIEPSIESLKRIKEKGKTTPSENNAITVYENYSKESKFTEAWFAFIGQRENRSKKPSNRSKVGLLNKLAKISK